MVYHYPFFFAHSEPPPPGVSPAPDISLSLSPSLYSCSPWPSPVAASSHRCIHCYSKIPKLGCLLMLCRIGSKTGPHSHGCIPNFFTGLVTSSLLADGLAVSGQAILAYAFTEKDHKKALTTAIRVAQMGVVVGLGLLVIVGAGLYFVAGVFTKDKNVLHMPVFSY
ncbi:hypothetical protein I3843_04G166800 [Carya illinoinensis]|nr:hypothetical protein I3843_04G166800 [Carya illinoinensis]